MPVASLLFDICGETKEEQEILMNNYNIFFHLLTDILITDK
jgi:hypothetical protein